MEAARLLPDHGEALRRDLGIADGEYRELDLLEEPLSPAQAEDEFLRAHKELTQHISRNP
jgi:hypothetical protein